MTSDDVDNDPQGVVAQIQTLGPWFHNLHLPDGSQTAPDHALGDFPAFKWDELKTHIPADLSGWRVLDVGCNAGFYSFALARRGAMVTAIDSDPHYLRQARWALTRYAGLEQRVRFSEASIYELAHWRERFDLVWFMGVLYHLRYPLLALDILRERVGGILVLQTLTMPGMAVLEPPADLPLNQREQLLQPGWPMLAFIERRLAHDPTNWWAPNHACVEAMLRASGFSVNAHPAHETYICAPDLGESEEGRWLRQREFDSVTGAK